MRWVEPYADIRMCSCGTDAWPPSPCLRIYTHGEREYATCPTCKKTWDVNTLKEVELNSECDSLC
jgi:hypothetical protein